MDIGRDLAWTIQFVHARAEHDRKLLGGTLMEAYECIQQSAFPSNSTNNRKNLYGHYKKLVNP